MSAKRSSTWWKWMLLLLVLGGTGYGAWRWQQRKAAAAAVSFRTAPIGRGEITQVVTANGQLTPVKNVQVGSQISGQILDLKVDFNSRVKEGDVIAQIDPSSYERTVAQSEAELLSAQAALELAELNHRRNGELLVASLISPSEADATRVALRQAEAAIKLREAALDRAKVDLQRTTILAPISGIVISRAVDVGQTVAASLSTPTLFLIANDLAQMQIDAMVSEADIGGIEVGQPVSFLVEAFPNRTFNGVVKQVRFAPTTNQNVVTYTTVVEVANPDLKLRPGMTANASIVTSKRTNVLTVPNAALRFRPPEIALLKVPTNAPAGVATTNAVAVALAPPGGAPAGMPTPPWAAEGRRPTPEERQKWMDSLTPEQRQQAQRMREQMRARMASGGGDGPPGGFGGGGPGGFGGMGASRAAQPDGPTIRTVYVPARTNAPNGLSIELARPVSVKLGATDGFITEVLEGLQEGDLVLTGNVTADTATTATGRPPPSANPFASGGGRRF